MTREEAIEILSTPFHMKGSSFEILEAHRMAVEALKQEPCEDCVSREAVLEQIDGWSEDEFLRATNPFYYLRKRVESLPSVNTKREGQYDKERSNKEVKRN